MPLKDFAVVVWNISSSRLTEAPPLTSCRNKVPRREDARGAKSNSWPSCCVLASVASVLVGFPDPPDIEAGARHPLPRPATGPQPGLRPGPRPAPGRDSRRGPCSLAGWEARSVVLARPPSPRANPPTGRVFSLSVLRAGAPRSLSHGGSVCREGLHGAPRAHGTERRSGTETSGSEARPPPSPE